MLTVALIRLITRPEIKQADDSQHQKSFPVHILCCFFLHGFALSLKKKIMWARAANSRKISHGIESEKKTHYGQNKHYKILSPISISTRVFAQQQINKTFMYIGTAGWQ